MAATATVNVGPCTRGGTSRVPVDAADHDFQPAGTVPPVDIFLPDSDELFLSAVRSKVTSDCLVDRLAQGWEAVRERCGHSTTLVINLDTGPKNHSRRTQFMHRLVACVQHYHVCVRLASSPPYPSTYNVIARCWGIVETHWNGTLLDAVETVVQFAGSMTWKGNHPVVELVTTTDQIGVKLTTEAMAVVEAQIERLPHLEKWFVDIVYPPPAVRDT
jgi:hypothetical protein